MLKNIDLLKYWTDLSTEKRQYATIFLAGCLVFWVVRKLELKDIAHKAEIKELQHRQEVINATAKAELDACNQSRLEDMRMFQDLYFETQTIKKDVYENTTD